MMSYLTQTGPDLISIQAPIKKASQVFRHSDETLGRRALRQKSWFSSDTSSLRPKKTGWNLPLLMLKLL